MSKINLEKEPWTQDAACINYPTDWFYPPVGVYSNVDQAVKICTDCTVRIWCLDYAFRTNDRYGIYGGYKPRERTTKLRRQTNDKINSILLRDQYCQTMPT